MCNNQEFMYRKIKTQINSTSEIIENYRKTCIFYVKLDLGILLALISLATLLELERIEVIRSVEKIKFLIMVFFVLLSLGLIFDYWLLMSWTDSKTKHKTDKQILKLPKRGILLQVTIHILLIALIGSYGVGWATGFISGYDNAYAEGYIISRIEGFAIEEGKYPNNLDELAVKYPDTKNYIDYFQSHIRYETNETVGYILKFPGNDGRLDTEDDRIYTHLIVKNITVQN